MELLAGFCLGLLVGLAFLVWSGWLRIWYWWHNA